MALNYNWSEIGEKIKKIRNSKNLTAEELAQKIGTSVSTVFRIENGQEPRALNLAKLAEVLDISLDTLLGLKEPNDKKADNNISPKYIPVIKNIYSYIENNMVLEDNIFYHLPLPPNKDADFGIEIQDDSMQPHLLIKDIALIKKQNLLNNDDIGAFIYINHFLIRKFYKTGNIIHLIAYNSEPIIIPKYKKTDLKILGKLVGKIRWFDNKGE